MIAFVTLAAISDWFTTRVFGEATLLAVVAVVIGYIVHRIWPKGFSPQLFAVLSAIVFLGALAWYGSAGATLAIVIFIAIAAVMAFTGML